MVDDKRLFLAPPTPYKFHSWPSIKDICTILPADKQVIIFENVIYIHFCVWGQN